MNTVEQIPGLLRTAEGFDAAAVRCAARGDTTNEIRLTLRSLRAVHLARAISARVCGDIAGVNRAMRQVLVNTRELRKMRGLP